MVNAANPQAAGRPERPPSPCINVCALDARGRCVGCLRTVEEIGRWIMMSADEQWQLLAELERRRKQP
ncbi:MAG: DUF1289 domain-containing protein [Gammaproteobacteria bacterium]|nr:DUF1289 domain-containing protein [Gammaproteobacteria bacterium]